MNKKALKLSAITSICLLSMSFTNLVYANDISSTTNTKVYTLSELEQSDNVVVERYSVSDYYNLMTKEKNTKAVNYLKNKYFNDSIKSGRSSLLTAESTVYVKVIKWTDPEGALFNLVSGMALEIELYPNLNEEIVGYVDGTSFCKVDGISNMQFVEDFEPIVTVPDRNNAYFVASGSLVGEVDKSLEAGFEAEGFSINVGSSSTIYVSKDKTINHSYYSY